MDSNFDWPSWIQAIGTVIALVISTALAIGVPIWIRELEARRYRSAILTQLETLISYAAVHTGLCVLAVREGYPQFWELYNDPKDFLVSNLKTLEAMPFALTERPEALADYNMIRAVLETLIEDGPRKAAAEKAVDSAARSTELLQDSMEQLLNAYASMLKIFKPHADALVIWALARQAYLPPSRAPRMARTWLGRYRAVPRVGFSADSMTSYEKRMPGIGRWVEVVSYRGGKALARTLRDRVAAKRDPRAELQKLWASNAESTAPATEVANEG